LERTTNVQLYNVNVYDHITGDFAIRASHSAVIQDTSTVTEITGCTTPFPATPGSTSACLTGSKGGCCYGAATNGALAPVQPTLAVTDGISLPGVNGWVARTFVRGATTAITAGNNSRIDQSTVFSMGSIGGGIKVGTLSTVAKNQLLSLPSGSTGILPDGGDSTAI